MGSLLVEAGLAGQQLTVKPGSDNQSVKVATISKVENNSNYLCLDKYPNKQDSYYDAAYSYNGAKEIDLDFKQTRFIVAESDCTLLGVTQTDECTAYRILTEMTNFVPFTDLSK